MKISIITPSFNQGTFIERTIRSVLSQQGDFLLEYIVIDGGSSDNSHDVIKSYASKLTWISEPDDGQSDAINKGLRLASGDILAWLNSDDTYLPGALQQVAAAYSMTPFLWCFGDCRIIDENDVEIRKMITRYKIGQSRRYSYRRLLRRDFIPQPSTFFTRTACDKVGPLNTDLVYSMDYDYWLRLGKHEPPRYINSYLANFRWHTASKNGARYRRAARETYRTAKRHARAMTIDVLLHYLHYHLLTIVYHLYQGR